MIKLCDINHEAKEKLPPAFPEKSRIGTHYIDAFIKPMNTTTEDGHRVMVKRKGLKIILRTKSATGEGLMRRLDVSEDPVVMLEAALKEAATNAGLEIEITENEILLGGLGEGDA